MISARTTHVSAAVPTVLAITLGAGALSVPSPPAPLRAAGLLDMDDAAIDGSHVRALKDISGSYEVKPPARLGVKGAV